MPTMTCPRCGADCEVGVANCPACGGYLGVKRPDAQQQPRREPDGATPRGPLWWFLELFPGLVRPRVIIASLLALPVAAGIAWLGLLLCALGALIAGILVGGFALVVYWTAVSWLIYGEVCVPAEALADFDGTRWVVFLLLAMAPITALFWYMGLAGS